MSASRFRPPKTWTPAERRQPVTSRRQDSTDSHYVKEPEPPPVVRIPRTGIRNMPRKKQAALRKERAADPAGSGVHSWRRRQW